MPTLSLGALPILAVATLLAGCGASATRSSDSVANGQPTDPRPTQSAPTQSAQTAAAPSRSHSRVPKTAPRNARECTRHDVTARFRPRSQGGTDGAGGHRIHILDFRNVSATPCRLHGYPRRVVAYEVGEPSVTATNGSFFPIGPSKAMLPGHVISLGLETDAECGADGRAMAGVLYRHVRVYLSGGAVSLALPHSDDLDAGCGLHLTPFGSWL